MPASGSRPDRRSKREAGGRQIFTGWSKDYGRHIPSILWQISAPAEMLRVRARAAHVSSQQAASSEGGVLALRFFGAVSLFSYTVISNVL